MYGYCEEAAVYVYVRIAEKTTMQYVDLDQATANLSTRPGRSVAGTSCDFGAERKVEEGQPTNLLTD